MIPLDSEPSLFLNRDTAIERLSHALRHGYMTLFVGAGISMSATSAFPNWIDLVQFCCQTRGVDFDRAKAMESNQYMRRRMEIVRDGLGASEFLAIVREGLYRNVKYDIHLMKTDLLVAMGSLVMGSLRGSAGAVFTYNFDDLLEWYLDFHGFTTDIVSRYPTVSRRADARVYHPHGCLPLTPKYAAAQTDKVLITEKDYQLSTAEVDPWNELQRAAIGSTIALLIGLSGDDTHVDHIFTYVYEKALTQKRLLGFMICKDSPQIRGEEKHFLSRGIAPVYVADYPDVPDLILTICRRAAEL